MKLTNILGNEEVMAASSFVLAAAEVTPYGDFSVTGTDDGGLSSRQAGGVAVSDGDTTGYGEVYGNQNLNNGDTNYGFEGRVDHKIDDNVSIYGKTVIDSENGTSATGGVIIKF